MERKQTQQKAQLAAQFNDFYIHITSPAVNQIGCYRIIDEIGEGAFGKVYLAMHIILNVKVVLKCGLIDDPNIVREVFYHRQLKHKNIVKLYEVIKTESHLWLVMEYCDGNELFYYIYEKRRLTYEECQRIFSQIVMGISYVHKLNLSHRDLKLENILLADKKKTVVKLTDFGFVREYDPRQRKLLSTVCGTTVYMAPELLKNENYSGFAADIWALGVILYTMFYGVMPFDEDDDLRTKFKIIHDEPEYRSGVPNEVILLIQRMLCKDPRQRASLSEVQNSSLLMDHNHHRRSRSSIHTDAGSIVSITQWYNDPGQPFESKVERHLLKRFRKLNIDVDHLKSSVQNRQMNSLTAFYELSLKHEFAKKRYYKEKKKKYNDARMSLRRSRDRFKSALSLSEQGGTQPLERIISSLSIGSNRNNSRTNISKMASPRLSTDSRLDGTKKHYSMNEKLNNRSAQGIENGNVLNRTVSFYPDTEKQSSKGTGMSLYSEESTSKRPKNSKILNKLQFWKRTKNTDDRSPELQTLEQFSNKSEMDDGAILAPSEKIPTINYIEDHADVNSPSPRSGVPPVENLENGNTLLNGTRTYRTRPSSVISQQSQLSHLSQLLTMISESELDMDETEMSDSMDEYAEYDEDGAYESSINASQHELQHNRGSAGALVPQKRRPSYRRNMSSDMSILSTSTNATGPQLTSQNSVPRLRHHSGHRKRSSMSRLSSNSSDEGQRLKKADNGSFSRLANTPQVTAASVFRPGTPDLSLNGNAYNAPTGFNFLDVSSNGSAPVVPRSQSPPLTTKTYSKPKPMKNIDSLAEKHRGATPTGGNLYETKFVIIDEEDED